MQKAFSIAAVYGREILDSRGNPTVEADVVLENGVMGRASVPSGASTGKFEAVELRDGENRYHGNGVKIAVHHIMTEFCELLKGQDVLDQGNIDYLLNRADGTENKGNLGANAILGVSLASAKAAAAALGVPLYFYLGGFRARQLPVPMMNVLNGGRHADNTVDLQEFMIMPVGADCMSNGIRMCTEVYHTLKGILNEKGLSTAVGDEGGFAPDMKDAREVFTYLMQAIEKAGYRPGHDICFAMDAASSELYSEEEGGYYFPGESKMKGEKVVRSAEEMVSYLNGLCNEFPIVSIEDGLHEEDWEGWRMMTERLGQKVQLVGDDLFVTNTKRLAQGIKNHTANAILVKVNQIGTLTESFEAIQMAQKAGYRCVISHRSGETEDATIADIAVAVNAGQIKTGAPCRSDRNAKYNQLLRIDGALGRMAIYQNPFEDWKIPAGK